MKQRNYRVTLYPNATSLCKELVLLAALSNGEPENKISLSDLEGVFKANSLTSPWSNKDCQCTVTGHQLTIDKMEDDKGVCLLAIEEVELIELAKNDENEY